MRFASHMRAAATFSLLCLGSAGSYAGADGTVSITKYKVSVSQHAALARPISEADVDRILTQVSDMLSAENPSCPVQLIRNGPVETYDSTKYSYSINSNPDFGKFKTAPPSLKI